ncbi:MAG: prepilin-type N-terminal cleavage/methylation domain-containing protein [bacterium]|nr:prepilin-type N-terminal cleavage/methylation domain-containing protein [bacterium]
MDGFTLIELLVVVSIIAILASIAVPNMIEARTRANVARMKSDLRNMTTAIESYHVDNNHYPYRRSTRPYAYMAEIETRPEHYSVLTTPIAYLTTVSVDIFEIRIGSPLNTVEYYDPVQTSWLINSRHPLRPERRVDPDQAGWLLFSVGPDNFIGKLYSANDNKPGGYPNSIGAMGTVFRSYDPTNGTISTGNIYTGSRGGMDNAGAMLESAVF